MHYKLDRGIHHVLIDEAQDTSPKQWEIVKALVSEFFAGQGAHERTRTIFAVGDEKQSIFSFQGAAPREFAAMREHFERRTGAPSLEFVADRVQAFVPLRRRTCSARSIRCSSRRRPIAGLTADPVPPVHEALPDDAPGLVEIWDLDEVRRARQRSRAGTRRSTCQTATSASVKLAAASPAPSRRGSGKAGAPKDVLILVRRRGALFEAIIRALKNENIPVAGADRLVLTEHIAVMDLMVLADALLLPEDDLALATVLKSPLFGLDDDALFKLAWDRDGSLLCRAARATARSRGAASTRCARSRAGRIAVRLLRLAARRRARPAQNPDAARS